MRTDLVVTEALAHKVRETLAENGWTQTDVERAGGPTTRTLRKILTGVGQPITLTALRRLDEGLHWDTGTAYRLARGLDYAGARPTTLSHRDAMLQRLGQSSIHDLPLQAMTDGQLQSLVDMLDSVVPPPDPIRRPRTARRQ